jgi:hypothetical protein
MTEHEQHMQHAKRVGVAVPCAAQHVALGGGCFNCLWEPTPTTAGQACYQGSNPVRTKGDSPRQPDKCG